MEQQVSFKFALGERVKHLTGFAGTVVGRVEYLSGCVQYLTKPKCEKGKEHIMPDGQWLDEAELVSVTKPKAQPVRRVVGGPRADAPTRR